MAAYLHSARRFPLAVLALLPSCSDAESSEAPRADPFDVVVATEPTPPAPDEAVFEPPASGFSGELTVALSTPSGRAALHYTLDGSLPTPSSPRYEAPLVLDSTTIVRVVSVVDGAVRSVAAATYVALDSDAVEFSSNLPIIVVERHGDSPIETDADDLRPASLLSFEPRASGRAALLGPATAMTRAGAKVRGQSSRGFPQKSYSLEFWSAEADDDHKASWLGMPPESDWALVAPSHMDRSLMRTMLPMDLSRAIGSYAPRTRFVEMFLVDREGSRSLSVDDYVGVYTAIERIKRDEHRVNVAKLEATAVTEPLLSGGYLIRIDHGGADFDAGGYGFQWDYPDAEVMSEPARRPQRDYLVGYLEGFFDALDGRAGAGNYADYIDTSKWIDHNLLSALTKNVDGLRLSAFFHKDREGKLVAGPIWDFDRSAGTPHDERCRDPEEWSSGDGTHPLRELFWRALFDRSEFERAYWERWDELVRSEFSVDALLARIDGYERTLLEARERHFARWPELPPQGGPAGEVELLREFYRRRVPWISSQRP